MLRHTVLLCLFGAAFGSYIPAGADLGETTSRPPVDDVDYFDCSGQTGTYHPHPWDCTRFIQCHNGRAADQPCAACNVGDPRCPEGYLNWNQRATTCDWPDVAGCAPGNPPTTAAPTTVKPTTAAPTTAKPTTAKPTTAAPTTARPTTAAPTTAAPTTARPTTAAPTTAAPTTAAPTTAKPTTAKPTTAKPTTAAPTTPDPTTADPTTAAPPVDEGEECDPDNCDVVGDCHGYTFCQRIISPAGPRNDTGVITVEDCGDLYFNPTKSNGSPIAVCDLWRDLDPATQEKYREDPTCDPYCKLIPEGDCSNAYIYRDPSGAESSRTCPADTILDVEARRCVDPCKASASAKCAPCSL